MPMPVTTKGAPRRIILIYRPLGLVGRPSITRWWWTASPFVIALNNTKICDLNPYTSICHTEWAILKYLLPDFVNATIYISVLSIGLSSVHAGSRALTAFAETGHAPKVSAHTDKSSRPLWSVFVAPPFPPLAYVNVAATGYTVTPGQLSPFRACPLARDLPFIIPRCLCHDLLAYHGLPLETGSPQENRRCRPRHWLHTLTIEEMRTVKTLFQALSTRIAKIPLFY